MIRAGTRWPVTTDDGRGAVWACCVSSIGPKCHHIIRTTTEETSMNTETSPGVELYETLMAVAIDLNEAANMLREGLDLDENAGPAEELADECAKVYEEAHRRVAAALNASALADTEGSASSQHYIETGIRLPVGGSWSVTS